MRVVVVADLDMDEFDALVLRAFKYMIICISRRS